MVFGRRLKKTRTGTTGQRFVAETVALIAERGGSSEVNLREVSRRVGCAHTNVYNYFEDFDALLWAAYRQALTIFAEYLVEGVPRTGSSHAIVRAMFERIFGFPLENPGLFRLINTDPLAMEKTPDDVLAAVESLRQAFANFVALAGGLEPESAEATNVANTIRSYIHGEAIDMINGRVIPGEDIRGRVVDNAMQLFALLVADAYPDGSGRFEESDRVVSFDELTL